MALAAQEFGGKPVLTGQPKGGGNKVEGNALEPLWGTSAATTTATTPQAYEFVNGEVFQAPCNITSHTCSTPDPKGS